MGYMKHIYFPRDHGLAADGKKLLVTTARSGRRTVVRAIFAAYTSRAFSPAQRDWVMANGGLSAVRYRYAAGQWTLTDTSACHSLALKEPFVVADECSRFGLRSVSVL
jgi:hypothetical protein